MVAKKNALTRKSASEKDRAKKQVGMSEDELDEQLDVIERGVGELSGGVESVEVKASKPITELKKGDIMVIDGMQVEVDSHYVLIDHGSTKEMAIEVFNPKTDRDYQLRYFDDQTDATLEFYELQEIMYLKRPMRSISW
ncbi:hypothetical protein HYZ97_03005 [Candidatus Pacearchaeota archaeon]|nr:hypothetical protein [Candidatus Pacearchaeota archaeon]